MKNIKRRTKKKQLTNKLIFFLLSGQVMSTDVFIYAHCLNKSED